MRDVHATVESVRWLTPDPAVLEADLDAVLLDADGNEITDLSGARQIRVTSTADVPVVVSFSYVVLEEAIGDEGAQNAEVLVLLVDRLHVPAGGTVTTDLTEEGIAAVRRWGDVPRYSELDFFFPAGQPSLAKVDG